MQTITDQLNNRALDPEMWGPHYWFMIHTIAFIYPDTPSNTHKKRYYEWFQTLPLFMPDAKSAAAVETLLAQYPVQPYLDSRTSLVKWTHFFHNKVNESLRKPVVSFDDFTRTYFDAYTPKHQRIRDYYKWKEQITKMAGLFIATVCATILYTKSV